MPLEVEDIARLRDMAVWSRKATTILGGLSFEALMGNDEKRLALVRCVEVIGEVILPPKNGRRDKVVLTCASSYQYAVPVPAGGCTLYPGPGRVFTRSTGPWPACLGG